MKKSFIAVAVSILFALGITSCQKQYDCVCKYTAAGIDQERVSQTIKTSNEKAKEICERATTIDGYAAKCSLK
jgi:hypothetical protein